ncbi:MAG: beta-ketoacyl-[acyl-carrier-protein] synthase family protein [Terriglobales bacterium]
MSSRNGASSPAKRVVVTGLGVISPLGNSAADLWLALAQGRSGITQLDHLALDAYRTRVGGAVLDFQPRQFIADAKTLKLMTRPVRLGVAAVEMAVRDGKLGESPAGAPPPGLDPGRIGCFVGSPGHAGDRDELLRALDLSYSAEGLDLRIFCADGIPTINPLWLLKSLANLVLYFVSMRLGAQGPNANICMSGAGGLMAVGEAFHAIRHGRADIALGGGYESLLDEERLESFEPSGLLYLGNGNAAAASRPFDRDRAGFVAAEGGAFLLLEELEHARRRGAAIHGEIRGYGCAASGLGGRPNDSAEGYAGAMQAALSDARLEPWDLDAVYAQGLALAEADRAEAQALKQVLTARAAYTPVTAIKSMTGNLLAGSGPLELIAALGALAPAGPASGLIPPILNCDHPDPDLGLDFVRGQARPGAYRRILVNASGLGGTMASIILQQVEA